MVQSLMNKGCETIIREERVVHSELLSGPERLISGPEDRQSQVMALAATGDVSDLLGPGKACVTVDEPPERQRVEKCRIIGVDPGGTNGITFYDGRLWVVIETPSLMDLWWCLNRWKPQIVIAERFIADGSPFDPGALHAEGVIRLWGEMYHGKKKLVWNLRSDKAFSSDELLKHCGLWVPLPQGHGRDAIRHVIHYLVHKERESKWIEWTKPSPS